MYFVRFCMKGLRIDGRSNSFREFAESCLVDSGHNDHEFFSSIAAEAIMSAQYAA